MNTMKSIKAREVFYVMPDGSVCKKVNSFREIFEAYEDVKTEGDVLIEEEVAESRRLRLERRAERLAKIEAIKAYTVAGFVFSTIAILVAVLR